MSRLWSSMAKMYHFKCSFSPFQDGLSRGCSWMGFGGGGGGGEKAPSLKSVTHIEQ